jgi:hypothetical protein
VSLTPNWDLAGFSLVFGALCSPGALTPLTALRSFYPDPTRVIGRRLGLRPNPDTEKVFAWFCPSPEPGDNETTLAG